MAFSIKGLFPSKPKRSKRKLTWEPLSAYKSKILICGYDKVGKTTLAQRLFGIDTSKGEESPHHATIYSVNYSYEEESYPLEIWDVQGSQTDGTINAGLYADTRVALIVVDCANTNSLNLVNFYFDNMKFLKNCKMYLVLNKADDGICREVTESEFQEEASNYELEYFEVSALNGTGIDELRRAIFRK